jgi:site-specific DNA-methyltransferase (adenine-specific)
MVDYSSSDGRTVPNDDNDTWVKPAFREIYRVLRWNRFCVSFYSWNKADKFLIAWREAGFRISHRNSVSIEQRVAPPATT